MLYYYNKYPKIGYLCLYSESAMSLNHQLRNCLFGFLSNKKFSSYEFKDIRHTFIRVYPEYSSKKFYPKIYLAIRELAEIGLIIIDKKACTYKYSSNYSKDELLNLIASDVTIQIKNTLLEEHKRVIENIDLLGNELTVYQLYLTKFPVLSGVISELVSEKNKELNFLKCALSALKNIMTYS